MFEPGRWHHANPSATADAPAYSIDLFYEVRQDAVEGAMLSMRLEGHVSGQSFSEDIELHADTAYNFASAVSRLAQKYGLPAASGMIKSGHQEYDLMYDDIRTKLGLNSGEAINLDHLTQDGF